MMNDFTKDELETILYCIDVVTHIENTDEQILIEKLQSMIDNYASAFCKCHGDWVCDGCAL